MAKALQAHDKFIKEMSDMFPKFKDVFDEETFYICFFVLALISIIGAFLASRYLTIKDAGHMD